VEELSKQRFEQMINVNGSINPVVRAMFFFPFRNSLIAVATTQVTTNVLSMLTRMRQLALHPGLVPSNYLEELKAAEDQGDAQPPAIRTTPKDRIRLQGLLSQIIEDCEECPICFSILTDPRITSCAHSFCLACISEVIARDPKCPMVSLLHPVLDFACVHLPSRIAVQ
jgi:SWI/SNF-related matrix-associated actin-dependent regulator of chromatin subfamily A3